MKIFFIRNAPNNIAGSLKVFPLYDEVVEKTFNINTFLFIYKPLGIFFFCKTSAIDLIFMKLWIIAVT